jgi:hypothetical protein
MSNCSISANERTARASRGGLGPVAAETVLADAVNPARPEFNVLCNRNDGFRATYHAVFHRHRFLVRTGAITAILPPCIRNHRLWCVDESLRQVL